MKKQLFAGIGAAIVAALMMILSVPAGAADVRCDIPFSFQVNGATLPPGTYNVSTEQSALMIRGATRGAVALGNLVESRQDTSPKLVFHKYGDEYFLRQVWSGGTSGRELPRPRRERELAEGARSGAVAAFERVVVPIS